MLAYLYYISRLTRPSSGSDFLPFLSLPPEIRNRIYNNLLEIDGPVHPSTKPPSSIPKPQISPKVQKPATGSVLNILAVNRQIHDEAVGIFYNSNAFEFYYPKQLHAFMVDLSSLRQGFIRDITFHYYNHKVGGIDLAYLTFPMLKQLPGLRRLHLLFNEGLTKRMQPSSYWGSGPWKLGGVNPITFPGIKFLFNLRNIDDIKVRDTHLETQMMSVEQNDSFPNFQPGTQQWAYVELTRILEHLNAALADAQQGKVNKKLLADDEWHLKDVYPALDDDV